MVVIRDKDTGEQIWRGTQTTLVGAVLRRVRLRYADLYQCDLRGADLSGANLWGADLRGADLRDADLRGAILWKADLRDANLICANLEGAVLCKADLSTARIAGTWVKGARYDLDTVWPPQIDPVKEQAVLNENSDPRDLHGVSNGTAAGDIRAHIAAHTRQRKPSDLPGREFPSIPEYLANNQPELRAPESPNFPWSRSYSVDMPKDS